MCGIGLVLTPLSSPCAGCVVNSQAASSSGSDDCLRGSLRPKIPLESSEFDNDLQRRLCQRGPDRYHQRIRRIASDSNGGNRFALAMHSAVLHLRGDQVTPQPVVDSADNVLCWNGEVFGMDSGGGEVFDQEEDDGEFLMHGSDTILLSEKLQSAGEKVTQKMTIKEIEDPVVEVLRRVRGPFAVVWLHANTQRVYFAHDRFGRRSLLYRRWGSGRRGDMIADLTGTETTSAEFFQSDMIRFVLSNVAVGDDDRDLAQYQELPASGIYMMDLRACEALTEGTLPSYRMEFHPYAPLVPELPLSPSMPEASNYVLDRFGCELPCPATASEADLAAKMLESSARALLVALSNAVGVRVRSIPLRPPSDGLEPTARVAVLFSGGLDSVVIAALTQFHIAAEEPVDLLTVCFDENSSFASPDRRAAELAHAELCALFPKRQWNLVKINVPRVELSREQRDIQTLMAPCDTHMDFNIGAAFWFLSRGRGELTISTQAAENATLEELNAFLKPQRADLRELETEVAALSLFDDQTANDNALLCPVIRCGRKRKHGCVLGVCKSCCLKVQRAVEKLVPLSRDSKNQHADQREAQSYRTKLVSMGIKSEAQLELLLDLVKAKLQQERDEASKSTSEQSFLYCRVHRFKQLSLPTQSNSTSTSPSATSSSKSSSSSHYQTSARVVLVGIGADEQLAGYGRHRTTLINGGEEALRAELQMDLGRIWKRNLGRDDRCIAAHGREARFPYLDEDVVSTIASFPVSSLCDADLPRGVGDKRALRVVAKTLGLKSCAGLAKRAIQFGSRIAKVSNTGSNRQTQGMNKFSSVD